MLNSSSNQPDYITAGIAYIRRLPFNRRFVLADIADNLPKPDHSCDSARLIGEARNRGLIVRAGYGPAKRPKSPLAPANVWRRTAAITIDEQS